MSEIMMCNGVVITGGIKPKVINDGAVVWSNDRIKAVGELNALAKQYPHAKKIDAKGGMILPGFVNLHHHFYSAFARGLNPGKNMKNFTEVLDRLWWRLDRALHDNAVKLSAELTLADCIRHGCTTFFDHHASPACLKGSLDRIAEVSESAGLRALLCYEVTDRNGHKEALAGIEENVRFMMTRKKSTRIRGTMGLHASFTLRDETLQLAAKKLEELAEGNESPGCHIHMAEDLADVKESLKMFGATPIDRLKQFGLLGKRTLLAHGVHLSSEQLKLAADHDATIIHNPESNANNGVGRFDPVRAIDAGVLVGLGTDGMSSSMLRSLRAAFLMHRAALKDPSVGFTGLPDLMFKNAALTARRFFPEPQLGELAPGAPADIAVIDCSPPTTISDENWFGHILYGASEYPVRHTIGNGRILFENFEFKTIDSERITHEAHTLAPDIWKRFQETSDGTPLLGL